MLTPKTRRILQQIIPFGLLWMLFSALYMLVEYGLLGDMPFYPSTSNPYNFKNVNITSLKVVINLLC